MIVFEKLVRGKFEWNVSAATVDDKIDVTEKLMVRIKCGLRRPKEG